MRFRRAISVWDLKCDHFGRVNFLGMAIIFCNDEGRSFWESQFFGNSDRFL
jgi:hypothetical protein